MTAVTASSADCALPPARRCRSRTARCQSAACIGPEPTGVRGSRPARAASLIRAFGGQREVGQRPPCCDPLGGLEHRRRRGAAAFPQSREHLARAASIGPRSVTGSSRTASGSAPCPLIVTMTSGEPSMRRAAHIVPWRQTSASPIGSVSRV